MGSPGSSGQLWSLQVQWGEQVSAGSSWEDRFFGAHQRVRTSD